MPGQPSYPSGLPALAFEPASRLSLLPQYVFVRLDELKKEARSKGQDLIDLSLGNPDGPSPAPVVAALSQLAGDSALHGYPPFDGLPDFKQAIAAWMERRYKVALCPREEVLPLPGSKEGLAHLALAFLNDKEIALVPDPCYPVHRRGPLLAGATIYPLPLTEENRFLPDLDAIPHSVAAGAKMLILNYPNNPTGAVATREFLERSISFCRRHEILLVHDFAYGELYFSHNKPPSILEFPGAKDLAVEFHTFSKTFSMAGWRVGFVVGNKDIIKTLYALKSNFDYGVFGALQKACAVALDLPDIEIEKIRNTYKTRRDILASGLQALGFSLPAPEATMYLWLPAAQKLNLTSQEFAERLLAETGVVVTPGAAFGQAGEWFIRISLVASPARLQEAIQRWKASQLAP